MKKITLQVNGREMTFSEQELSSILEEHFSSKTTQQTTTVKVAQKPTEGEWFEVKPQAINQKLFETKRPAVRQENTRRLILEAFVEMQNEPEKYAKKFFTMMPKKTWRHKTFVELEEMASKLGDHNANWVEQALEWAQRIANGESWEAICNDNDTANWYRLVVWKSGYARHVGGSVCNNHDLPASCVADFDCSELDSLEYTVPLVVSYK